MSCLFCKKHITGKPCLSTCIFWVTVKEERRRKDLETIPVLRVAVLDKDTRCGRSGHRTIGKQDFLLLISSNSSSYFPSPILWPCPGEQQLHWELCCTGWKSLFQLLLHSFTLQITSLICTYNRECEDVILLSELRGLQEERMPPQVTQPLSNPSQHLEQSKLPIRSQTSLQLVDNSVLERTHEIIIIEN